MFDIVVIGAGISGLTFAHYAHREGLNIAVLEASPLPGGNVHSIQKKQFSFELGAHTLYRSYAKVFELIQSLGLEDQIIPKRHLPFRIYRHGKLIPLWRSVSWLSVLSSMPKWFKALSHSPSDDVTVKDYYLPLLGKDLFENLLSPAVNAMLCQEAESFNASLIFKKRPKLKDLPSSFTLKHGLSQLIQALAEPLDVHYNARVITLSSRAHGFEIKLSNGQIFQSAFVVMATPPDIAAELLAKEFPNLSEILKTFPVTEIPSYGVSWFRNDIEWPQMAGFFPSPPDIFYAAVSKDVTPHPLLRALTFHFKPGISASTAQVKIQQVLKQTHLPELHYHLHRLPLLGIHHAQKLHRLKEMFRQIPLTLVGNYFGGLSLEDCVQRSTEAWQAFKTVHLRP